MAEPKVSVLLEMVDKLTQPMTGMRGTLGSLKTSFKNLGTEAKELLSNRLVQGVGIVGLWQGLQKSFAAADQFTVALQKLQGTAKITGVPLETLTAIADNAEQQFGLSKAQASDFAVEMAKLATKAGDVGKAGPAMQSFLDIGAARGLTASETLKAVQQAILGIDEGTDKLFNANPSVLYQRYADSIGVAVGALTDQQKAQALLNATMEDGGKVQGQYAAWLDTVAGKEQLASNRTTAAWAALGAALGEARVALANITAWIAEQAVNFVGGIQMLGAGAANFFLGLPDKFRSAWGTFLVSVANSIGESRILLTLFGDGLTQIADSMGNAGTRMVRESAVNLRNLQAGYDATIAEIVGVTIAGEHRQTEAQAAGVEARAGVAAGDAKQREATEKKAQAALAKLREGEQRAILEGMSAFRRAMFELQEKMDEAMLSQNAQTREEATRLWRSGVSRIATEFLALEPQVRRTTLAIRGDLLALPSALDEGGTATEDAVVKWERLKSQIGETGASIGKGAEQILRFGRDIGSVNPQLESLIGGIGRLAEGIGGVAKGDLLGGISSAVLGLQGIVGGLFGNSPEEQARKQLLRENSQRLRELRDKVGDLLTAQSSGATIAKAQGLDLTRFRAGDDDANDRMQRLAGLGAYLGSQGLTMSDFSSVLGDLGIDWGAWQKDGITRAMIKQLQDGLANFEPAQFDQSFGGQQDFLERYFGVAGIEDPAMQAEFARVNLIGKSDYLASLIGGANLTTAGGRSALRTQFAEIFQQLNNGTFNAGNFGQLTGSEFTDFIEYFIGLMDQMGAGAPSTGVASSVARAVTAGVSESFAAPSGTTGAASGEITGHLSAIENNTRVSAEELARIRSAVESAVVSTADRMGVTRDMIDQWLQSERDLTRQTQGAN